MHSRSGIFLPRVIYFTQNNKLSCISFFSHVGALLVCQAKWTHRTFFANSCWPSFWPGRLVGTSGTWPSQRTNTHLWFALFFSVQGEISAWLNVIETQRTTMHTHTHTEVASRVGRNLEKAPFPGEFPWMACLREHNNCSFTPSFHSSLHSSIYPGKRKSETLIHEPWV